MFVRRALATVTVAGMALLGSPLVGTGHAATNPKLTASFPQAGGSVVDGSQTLTATYDQQIAATSASTFTVYELANGSRVNALPGTVKFAASNQFGGTTDTIEFAPQTAIPATAEYEAVIHVEGVDSNGDPNPASVTDTDFDFWVDNRPPQNPSGPAYINNSNDSAVPFTGTAAPGLTVTVTLTNDSAPAVPAATGTATVAGCSAAPNCPWTAKVDASNVPDGNYHWSATTTDAGNASSDPSTSTAIVRDTQAPSAPSSVTAAFTDNTDQALEVTATDSASDMGHYTVTVADADGNSVSQDFAPQNDGSLDGIADVSSLDDGGLTVSVFAVDTHGNVSSAGQPSSQPTKDAGLALDFSGSTFTTPSGTVGFPAAEAHAIQSPTAVNLHFTEPVKQSWTDQTSPTPSSPTGTVHHTTVCVHDTVSGGSGSCVVFSSNPTISSDGRTMTVPVPTQLADSGSPYTIIVTTWSKNLCPDKTPQNTLDSSWSCETLTGTVTDPSTITSYTVSDGANPLEVTLDDVAPRKPTVSVSPATLINATTIDNVHFSGTSDAGTTVKVSVKSSAGGSRLLLNGGQPITVTNGTWSVTGSLRSVPDGVLTVVATASDEAGNAASASPSTAPLLAARPSKPQSVRLTNGASSARLTWAKPATTGGHAITGYTITWRQLGTTTTHTKTVSASTFGYRITGLTLGKKYAVRLWASNDVGNGAVVSATAWARYPTALTVKASAHRITYGQAVKLSGRLTRTDTGNGLANTAISLRPRWDNGTFGKAVALKTDSFGFWSYRLRPAHNAVYYVTYAGTPTVASAVGTTRVRVRSLIRFTSPASGSSVGSPVTVTGVVSPNKAGRYVYFYRHTSSGNVYLGRAKLTSTSRFAIRLRMVSGRNLIWAKIRNTYGNLGNRTGYLTLFR